MTGGERQALIVVTSAYDDPGLGALRAPTDDAEALAEVLGDPDVGGFEVEVLTDPDSHRLRVEVEDFFADRSPRHTLLLHFSCHGVKNAAGKLFLATTDTRRTRLASTSVPAEYVSGLMLTSRAQCAVVLLDCCYAGAFERGMFARAGADAQVQESFQDLERTGGRRGRAVFTASSAVEYAFEEDLPVPGAEAAGERRPSLFTGSLVEGLRSGEADRDGDGEVGMSELADYVSDRLSDMTPHQTPQLWLFGVHGGDMAIARTRLRTPAPAALPAPLDTAAHSASRERRLWAAQDLGSLLRGDDVGIALSARTTLAELAHDDSRRVSENAERALRAARPRLAAASLDLGTVTAGTPGPQTLITVEGPPIVRATVEAVPEAPWLRTACVPDGVQLSVDVAAPGRYEGEVLLRTATGELPLHVGVEAVPVRTPGPRRKRERPVREPVREVVEEKPEEPEPPAGEAAWPWTARPGAAPLWLAFVLTVIALVTPIMSADGGPYGDYFWHTRVTGFLGWLLAISLWAAAATTCALGTLALRRSGLLFRLPALAWLGCVTAATAASMGYVYSVLGTYQEPGEVFFQPSTAAALLASDFRITLGPGGVALTLLCAAELWCCVTLWRHRREPMPTPARPRRG
ncbi:caspase family protein [Streptomyces sp. NPDC020472]|uniref:caspase, EACC1-associated type n=1 Tax=Streptomyces sp. NPDC020472 TaxID=3365075 RepID=UPI00379C8FF1